MLGTCSAEGEPNVTHLSQLYLVDANHIALSNQFFGKTTANLAENPNACVLVTDSQTYETYRITCRFDRTEMSGALFDEMRTALASVASLMHMEDVFVLRGADVYQVLRVEPLSSPASR